MRKRELNSIRSANSSLFFCFFFIIRVSSARLFISLSTWRFNLDTTASQIPASGFFLFSILSLSVYLWITVWTMEGGKKRTRGRPLKEKRSWINRPYRTASTVAAFLDLTNLYLEKLICDDFLFRLYLSISSTSTVNSGRLFCFWCARLWATTTTSEKKLQSYQSWAECLFDARPVFWRRDPTQNVQIAAIKNLTIVVL